MKSLSGQKDLLPAGDPATGFLHVMHFDMHFNYTGGSIEQINIAPDAPGNWESENCRLIHYVRYEYTRVSKKNPEDDRSGPARINHARKKVRFFASLTKKNGAVLRIVKDTIVTRLATDVHASGEVTIYCLERSHDSLDTDPIASASKTSEFSSQAKEIAKGASKKRGSGSNRRRRSK